MNTANRWVCGIAVGALWTMGGPLWAGEGSGSHRDEGSGSARKPEGSKKEEKSALALEGTCSVCLVEMGKKVEGKEEYSSVYKGIEYRFPSEEQKKMFDANPKKYALQSDGNCVVCKVDMKKDVKGDPAIYSVHNGKIYAFVNEETKRKFEADPAKYTGEKPAPKKPSEGSHREGSGR